jgi:nucleotide-binding universal stress UspA family protein
MTVWLFLIFVVFLCIGLVTALVMGRRGHDPWTWGILGALFGPLVIPLAFGWHSRDQRDEERVLRPAATPEGAGPVSVLVGVDGSIESAAAVRAAVDILGSRLGSLTIATVVDLDAMESMQATGHSELERKAKSLLEEAAATVASNGPATVILSGRPTDALVGYAQRHDIDLVAVGARGKGLSEAALGSVAEGLVRQPDVVVLIAGRRSAGSVIGSRDRSADRS